MGEHFLQDLLAVSMIMPLIATRSKQLGASPLLVGLIGEYLINSNVSITACKKNSIIEMTEFYLEHFAILSLLKKVNST